MANSGGSSVVANGKAKQVEATWEPKLKTYRHFDNLPSTKSIKLLVKDKAAVASHAFYPLISFRKKWKKYAPKGTEKPKKDREIKYASRKDAAIFSYYRSLLSVGYEETLQKENLEHSVLAYRKIPRLNGKGKSNIEFAYDTFSAIREMGNCTVATLDLTKFFDRLDHKYIKRIWKQHLGTDELDKDHYQVFKHLTKYSEVEMEDLLVELSIKGDVEQVDGKIRRGFLKHKKDIHYQVCYPDEFREKIANSGNIQTHKKKGRPAFGIPQGVPLSDLIANAYMLEFDKTASKYIRRLGGYYARYSDDILLILPKPLCAMIKVVGFLDRSLDKLAPRMKFNGKKTEIGEFSAAAVGQNYKKFMGSKDGLTYLGFRFDGKRVYIRNSTISNLHRNIAKACNRYVTIASKRYPSGDKLKLLKSTPIGRVMEQTGKVENFESVATEYRSWTFWTYAARAHSVFKDFGSGIEKQLNSYKRITQNKLEQRVDQTIKERASPFFGSTRKK